MGYQSTNQGRNQQLGGSSRNPRPEVDPNRKDMIPQTDFSKDPASETALGRLQESYALQAEECLKFLLRDIYAGEHCIGQLLRKRAGLDGVAHEEEDSYKNAACNWHTSLTALSSPERNLLELANTFLHSRQFIYWAESSITDANDFQAIRSTEKKLTIWLQGLDQDCDRALLHLDAYFEVPYKGNWGDKEVQWLAHMRLGFYYFDKGRITDMAKLRPKVAEGLSDLLGRSHPLALQASSDAIYTLLFNGELREARKRYDEVADVQKKFVDENDPSRYFTLVYRAQTEYLMMDPTTALNTLALSLEGFIQTTGPQSNGYLIARLWTAAASAVLGDVKQAIKMLEYVRDKRKEQYGPDDSFGIAAQIFAGDLYRKLNIQEKALENIEPALSSRRAFWPVSHFLTLDTALILAITYRDFGRGSEAAQIIAELEQDENVNQEQNFVRSCQVEHMRALLLFDAGNINQAIRKLETFLTDLDGKRNNRALHWIRLDLAYMFRYRKGEKDAQSARSLFDGIVTDLVDDQAISADPTHRQVIAEKALKLYRFNEVDAANKLLREENLCWVREEALWMWVGVPAADTGWMRLP